MVFLHGILDVTIAKASQLRNSEFGFKEKETKPHPYVVVTLISENGKKSNIATTSVIDHSFDPEWNERYVVDVCHDASNIQITVYTKGYFKSKVIGYCYLLSEKVINGAGYSGSLDLSEGGFTGTFNLIANKKKKVNGTLFLSLSFIDKSSIPNKDSFEVPSCPFPTRHNNHLVLYQDAHCLSLPLQLKRLDNSDYVPRSAWKDIHTAITQATSIIYIIGWSASVDTTLLRNEGEDTRTLGEILKQKAYTGVKVKLLLWNELTSNSVVPGMKIGFMKTEDNKTKDFFSGTTVDIALQPIDGKKSNIECYTQTILKGFAFSHHQKTVITDTPIATNPNQRRLVAFIGGLDLTGGRYDTPEHPLFHTLLNEHKDDFINPTLPSLTSSSGPREPFHDIHSRVEGPVARDILKNFEERWAKCANSAVQTEKNLDLVYNFHGWESWSVQMFRSINEYSVDLDTYQMSTGSTQIFPNIQQKRGTKFDRSLHRSYIHHIRRAQSFIYMENQYFKGSRHMWQKSEDGRAGNLIPIEIVIKIEEKITRNESFVAYIVIPMFPSGKPDSTFIQEMLYKQKQTIDLMYSRIAKAIKRSSRPDAHPQDYLLFFCLGSKVPPAARPESLVPPKEKGTDMAFHNRRNMIYVHSKMAIFDDEYIIVGSANINDRSMSGSRDTEIAIGAYQPNALANGDISVFRKALWAEHLGSNTPTNVWDHPGSLQCSKRLHQLGEESLQAYIKIGDHATPHHLMIYPLRVYQDGKVTARPDFEYIPDTKAKIIGSMSIFPQVLTA